MDVRFIDIPFVWWQEFPMPRYARFHVTGGLFHVISRFHDRRFYLDVDGARELYLDLLAKAADSHDARIVAYCLMSSHVHLVLQLGNDSLGRLTKQIHSPFGNWINAVRKGVGAVFADRPKSVLVHTETYGMELIRYVHNNPVRAGVVERAVESGWSSHRAYLGLEPCPAWLATNAVLGVNGNESEMARHDLACFVDEGRLEKRRPEFSGEVSNTLARRLRKLLGGDVELSYPVLGPDAFVINALKAQAHRHQAHAVSSEINAEQLISEVFRALGLDPELAPKRIKPPDVARARALTAWLWVEKMGHPQVTIAEALGLRPSTVSGILTQLRHEGLKSNERHMLDEIFTKITSKNEKPNPQVPQEAKANEPQVMTLKRNRKQ